VKRFPITWTIRAPDSAFYPGRHSGQLEIWNNYPFDQPYIIWKTPIYSPFVRFNGPGQRPSISSPFDLGKWQPFYTIQDVLQTIANFLVLHPFCERPPTINWPENMPWKYSDLSIPNGPSSIGGGNFFSVTNFFCRAYNSIGERRSTNPRIDDTQISASIEAISAIQAAYGPFSENLDLMARFEPNMTNEEWILEERRVADILSRICKLGFV
jgi:hypothetical protein